MGVLRGGVVGGEGGGTGEQRASFRVDRSGGLYQNSTFVDYMTKRRGNKERTRSERECLHGPASCHERALHGNLLTCSKQVILKFKQK